MQNAVHAKITVPGHGAGIVSDAGAAADRAGEAGPAAQVLIRAGSGGHDFLNC
jgi:hypothetical protein